MTPSVAPAWTDPPRLRLSAASFAAVCGESSGPPARAVLDELGAAGAVVRRRDGALVADPALQAALRARAGASVGVDAVRTAGRVSVHVEGAIDPPLGVVVVRGRRHGRVLDAVDVVVPGPGGVLGEVLRQVCATPVGDGDVVWAWVRAGTATWAGCYPATTDGRRLRRHLTHALVAATAHHELEGPDACR